MTDKFDSNPTTLLPHRAPMLLLDEVLAVSETAATALAAVNSDSLFHVPGKGIPAWVGLEYMGQTAALIAGHQQQQGQLAPHTGFLLGSRRYEASQPWFQPGRRYQVNVQQDTILGESLASFVCNIEDCDAASQVASASLTVYRQAGTNS